MARSQAMLGVAAILAGIGCSGSAISQKCGLDAGPCPSGDVCIMGGTCAQLCDSDGAAPCPSGTSCQTKGGYCTGTACAAKAVSVCQ